MTATTEENAQEHGEEFVNTYNQVIKRGITAIETGWQQTMAAAKQFAEASQAEMDAAGKTWESVVNQAQRRNEELAGLFKTPATFPSSGSAGFESETTEMVDQLIEDAKSYSQSWTGYLAGLEKRQAAFLKGLPETNSKIVESSQELAKSAAVYSEAFLQWSREAAKGVSTKTKS